MKQKIEAVIYTNFVIAGDLFPLFVPPFSYL